MMMIVMTIDRDRSISNILKYLGWDGMSVQVATHLFLDQVSICPSPSYTLGEYSGKIFKIPNIHDDPDEEHPGYTQSWVPLTSEL